MTHNELLSIKCRSLVIFRHLEKDPVFTALAELLAADPSDPAVFAPAYSRFAGELFDTTGNLSEYLLNFILEDENIYMKESAAGRTPGAQLTACLHSELAFLEELARLDSRALRSGISEIELPDWPCSSVSFEEAYQKRLLEIPKKGYGIFAKYHVFTINNDHTLIPVRYPDPQTLAQLSGYTAERSLLIANTEALLAGMPANNALLYGDAGTGKSSSVKAIANAYRDRGLRLIEVRKNQLYLLPDLMDSLSGNPCKFILFIDDLSFTTHDSDFSALKAILEGSVSGRSGNIVIYATSNRRHLVKESFSERDGDDVHHGDTMQELMSLSARFGLTITFQRPEKKLYLQIVHDLAKQYGVDMPFDELDIKAEAHAIRHGGRSPRTAKQFIEMTKSGVLE